MSGGNPHSGQLLLDSGSSPCPVLCDFSKTPYDFMKLTPEMINRLVAVKSLLGLEDWDLVVAAAERLESAREQEEIASILEALDEHRYAEAAQLIDKILSDGTRLAEWRDPEISLLEAELARVTEELADLEINHAETEHRISRFQAAHNKALGERIAKGENLKAVLASATAEGYPTAKSAKALAEKLEVNTPIIDEVYAMLYEGKDVKQAVNDLTTRIPKSEN